MNPRLFSLQVASQYLGIPPTTLRDLALGIRPRNAKRDPKTGRVIPIVAGREPCLPVVRAPGSSRLWFDVRDLDRAIEAWKERRA